MTTIATVGLDIAKHVFQVHAVDARGKPVVRKQLKRRQVLSFFANMPPCLIRVVSPKPRKFQKSFNSIS